MPYSSNTELPDPMAHMPAGAKTIWRKAFNSAFESSCEGDESCASRVAWSVVKKSYVKKGDKWMKMKQMQQLVAQFDWQFTLDVPDVPLNAGVDIEALTQGDENVTFITLPFAKDGGVATNGLRYTPQFNAALMQAIQANGILANMGHPDPFRMDFNMPAAIWVGAMRDVKGLYWGKAYVVDTDLKKFVRQLQATSAFITTSIYAPYDHTKIIEHADKTWEVPPDAFSLTFLDFAPQKGAALQFPERANMSITAQMNLDEEDTMEETAVLTQQLAAVNDQLKAVVTERDELKSTLTQLQADTAELQSRVRIYRLADTIRQSVKVNSPVLHEFISNKLALQVTAQMTDEEISALVDGILDSEVYKQLAQAVVSQMAGGSVITAAEGASDTTLADKIMKDLPGLLSKYGV
jgi:cation transport regulator ChaB